MRDLSDFLPSILCAAAALVFSIFWLFDTEGFEARTILRREYILRRGAPGAAVIVEKQSQNLRTLRRRRGIPVDYGNYHLSLEWRQQGTDRPPTKVVAPITQIGWNRVREGDRVGVHYLPARPDWMALDDDFGYTNWMSLIVIGAALFGSLFFLMGAALLWPRPL